MTIKDTTYGIVNQ